MVDMLADDDAPYDSDNDVSGDRRDNENSGGFVEIDQDWLQIQVKSKLGLSLAMSQQFAVKNSAKFRQYFEDKSVPMVCIRTAYELVQTVMQEEEIAEVEPDTTENVDEEVVEDVDAIRVTQSMINKARKAVTKGKPKIKKNIKTSKISVTSTIADSIKPELSVDERKDTENVTNTQEIVVTHTKTKDTINSLAAASKKQVPPKNQATDQPECTVQLVSSVIADEQCIPNQREVNKTYTILYFIRQKHTDEFRKLNKIVEDDFQSGCVKICSKFHCVLACHNQIAQDIWEPDPVQCFIQVLKILSVSTMEDQPTGDEASSGNNCGCQLSTYLATKSLKYLTPEFFDKNSLHLPEEPGSQLKVTKQNFEELSKLIKLWRSRASKEGNNKILIQPHALEHYIDYLLQDLIQVLFLEMQLKSSALVAVIEFSKTQSADVLHDQIDDMELKLQTRKTRLVDMLHWSLPLVKYTSNQCQSVEQLQHLLYNVSFWLNTVYHVPHVRHHSELLQDSFFAALSTINGQTQSPPIIFLLRLVITDILDILHHILPVYTIFKEAKINLTGYVDALVNWKFDLLEDNDVGFRIWVKSNLLEFDRMQYAAAVLSQLSDAKSKFIEDADGLEIVLDAIDEIPKNANIYLKSNGLYLENIIAV